MMMMMIIIIIIIKYIYIAQDCEKLQMMPGVGSSKSRGQWWVGRAT